MRSAAIFFWLCPSTFLALQVQLVVFVSAFVFDSTVWSVPFCFSFTHGAPPPCPFSSSCRIESAPLLWPVTEPITPFSLVIGIFIRLQQQVINTVYTVIYTVQCTECSL